MSLDPVELEERLHAAASTAEQDSPVKEAARRACEAAGHLVQHREKFLARAETLFDRDLVVAGKVVNVVTSGVGIALLFSPAAPAGVGLVAGLVGATSSIAASCHDGSLDKRCRQLETEMPAFMERDRILVDEMKARCDGFIQLLQVDCGVEPGGAANNKELIPPEVPAVAAAVSGVAAGTAQAGLSITKEAGEQAAQQMLRAKAAAEAIAKEATRKAAESAAQAAAAADAAKAAKAALVGAQEASARVAAAGAQEATKQAAAQAAARAAAEASSSAAAVADAAQRAAAEAAARADAATAVVDRLTQPGFLPEWLSWLFDSPFDTDLYFAAKDAQQATAAKDAAEAVFKQAAENSQRLQAIAASEASRAAAAAEASQKASLAASAASAKVKAAEKAAAVAGQAVKKAAVAQGAAVKEAAEATRQVASASADATQVATQNAAKIGFWRVFGVSTTLLGAGLSVYDLWKAASKADPSFKGYVETLRDSTKEPRRIRACMGNFLNLAVVLTRASPAPRRGGNLERLIAYALTEDASEDVLQLVAMLGGDALNFDPRHSRIYSLTPVEYGLKGGHMYYKPTGWVRYSRKIPNFEMYEDWCVAYHGTRARNESQRGMHLRLLMQGLRQPSTPWTTGQAWSTSGKTIYVSPSVEYASQYSALIPIHGDQEHWVQLVFQCRVRPGSFKVHPSTLEHRWKEEEVRHDPNFSNQEVEWLLEHESDVVITGVMVREFGRKADPSTYGATATKVRADFTARWVHSKPKREFTGTGAFFSWTWQRQEELLELTRRGLVRPP